MVLVIVYYLFITKSVFKPSYLSVNFYFFNLRVHHPCLTQCIYINLIKNYKIQHCFSWIIKYYFFIEIDMWRTWNMKCKIKLIFSYCIRQYSRVVLFSKEKFIFSIKIYLKHAGKGKGIYWSFASWLIFD